MRPEKVQQRQLGSQPLYALRSPSACTADRTAAGLPVRLDRCWRDSRVETMANVGVDGGGRKGRCRKSGPWRCPAYGGGADEPTGHRSSARLRELHHTNVVVNSGRPSGAVGPPTMYSVSADSCAGPASTSGWYRYVKGQSRPRRLMVSLRSLLQDDKGAHDPFAGAPPQQAGQVSSRARTGTGRSR
jgi:hypothetical protein